MLVMSKSKILFVVSLVALGLQALWLPEVAHANGSLRCGTKLVQRGMDMWKVKALCGEPTATEVHNSVWIYDRDRSELRKVITFVNGTVEFIDEVRKTNELQDARGGSASP